MMGLFNITVQSVSGRELQRRIDTVIADDTTMLMIHNEFARYCDEYVPMLNGPLSQSGLSQVFPDHVRYGGKDIDVPYAARQYYGTDFNHTLDWHPKATAYWDKVMMQERGDSFLDDIKSILIRRYHDIYG